jgi:hypothetical protein
MIHTPKLRPVRCVNGDCGKKEGNRTQAGQYLHNEIETEQIFLLEPLQEFLRQDFVSGCAGTVFIVVNDRLSKARRLREARGARDDRFKDLGAKEISNFSDHLLRQTGPSVKHRHDNADQLQARIDLAVLKLFQDPVQHRDPFQCVILALQGHEQSMRGDESIESQNTESGRAIDNDKIKTLRLENRPQNFRQFLKMIFRTSQLDINAAKIDFTRDDFQMVKGGLLNFLEQRAFTDKWTICTGALHFFQTDATRGIGLWIQVEQQNIFSEGGEAGGEINGRGGLANTTFLIGNSDDSRRHKADLPPSTGDTKRISTDISPYKKGKKSQRFLLSVVHELV